MNSHESGLDRIAPGDRRRGEGRQTNWRGHVGHDAEVKHEEMDRDQRHDEPGLLAQGDDDRGEQTGDHDVVGRSRQAHTQDQAQDRRQQQHQHDVTER